MSDFVRVRLSNGTEKTVSAAIAKRADLKPLDKPALAADGRPVPPKRRAQLSKTNTEAKSSEKKEG